MQQKNVAFRKRTQIAQASRTMFLWVACASVIFGIATVGTIFLTQKLLYNERVLAEKYRTIDTLKQNNANISKLESAIRVLDTNQNLIDSKAEDKDQAVQVILDALPSEANSLALGASLQNKLLTGIPNLVLDSLQVDPVVGIESLSSDGVTSNTLTASSISDNYISFRFSVTGNDDALSKVLQNLEKSIRTINVTSLKIESQESNRVLTVEAQAFYEPERIVELKDIKVK